MLKLPKDKIKEKIRVDLVGVGGTGSIVLSMLAQMHFLLQSLDDETGLSVSAYDPDIVTPSNIGRQNFWEFDLDRPKAKTLVERINAGFGLNWSAFDREYDMNCLSENYFAPPDVILTCVDAIKPRIDIGEKGAGLEKDTVWIDVGNGASSGQVITGHLGTPKSQPRKPNWYDLVGERMRGVKEDNSDSCSAVDSLRKQDFGINHLSAVNMTQGLWQYLRYGKIEHAYQSYDLKAGTAHSLPMTEQTYASFGIVQAT